MLDNLGRLCTKKVKVSCIIYANYHSWIDSGLPNINWQSPVAADNTGLLNINWQSPVAADNTGLPNINWQSPEGSYGQEPSNGESTNTECGVNYQLQQ